MATMTDPSTNSLRSCPPRYATLRRPDRPTFGGELAKVAAALGQPLMPWQRLVADVGCEYDPDTGVPFYRGVGVTVPRQQGKTTLFLSWQINRCVSARWSHPQRTAFTAQTGKDARDKWLDEIFPLIRGSKVKQTVAKKGGRLAINEGMGNESIRFATGSLIRLLSTSAGSGHSKTLHQAVMDEIWHDVDDRREAGLRPAMLTIPDAQLLWCSTAGTQASTVYNRKVQAGRLAVAEDTGAGVAYFEWSAGDDWDPADDDSYFGFMPALCPNPPCRCGEPDGWRHTVTMDVIRSERAELEAPEFRRAYGNRPTAGADMVIPPEVWRRVCDENVKPDGRLRFAVDVAEDRASAAVVAYADGVCELVAHEPGLAWVVDRCNELAATHGGTVALDFGGPAGVFADQINNVRKMAGREVIQACASMFDAIVEDRIRFRASTASTDPFTAAVEGAVKKQVSDQWVWSRKASMADVTPLMAATLAAAQQDDQEKKPLIAFA